MAEKSGVAHRNIIVRSLTAIVLAMLCLFGAATVGSTSADARGRGWGRGRGYYRGRGWGRGYGFYAAPYVAPRGCYWSRRWGRWVCPYY